jgi:hypothetical protein
MPSNIIQFKDNGNKPKSPARGKRISKQEKQAAVEAILRAYRPAGSVRIA